MTLLIANAVWPYMDPYFQKEKIGNNRTIEIIGNIQNIKECGEKEKTFKTFQPFSKMLN